MILTEKYSFEHESRAEDFPCCRSAVGGLKLLFDSLAASQAGIAVRADIQRQVCRWYIHFDLELD